MPKSSRSITPKASSKNRQSSPSAKASSKSAKNGHSKNEGKSEKADSKNGQKNGHKNGKAEGTSSVATPSKSLTDSNEKDAKGVQIGRAHV